MVPDFQQNTLNFAPENPLLQWIIGGGGSGGATAPLHLVSPPMISSLHISSSYHLRIVILFRMTKTVYLKAMHNWLKKNNFD